MKKLLCILVSILLLCACTGKKDDITSNSAIKNSVELKTSTFSIDGYEFFDKNATIAIKKIGGTFAFVPCRSRDHFVADRRAAGILCQRRRGQQPHEQADRQQNAQ